MIDRGHDLPIAGQAKALGISRGSVYYRPRPVSAGDLAVMRRVDELCLELPFAGSRMLRDLLNRAGTAVGRCQVATLMKRLRIEALYRKPNTSKPMPGHKIYPYLLRDLTIDRPNQVWAMDITHVPMARGFVYLAAIIDWFSRRVLSWRLSITMEADFCVEVLEEALARHGKPEIFNSDQSSQFTSYAEMWVTTVVCRGRIEAGVEPARTSHRERYAMDSPTNIVRLRQPEDIDDPLTEVLRVGARRLLAQAVELEAEAFLSAMQDL